MSVRKQRGAALIAAVLVVALATVLIAAMLDRSEAALARTRNLQRAEQRLTLVVPMVFLMIGALLFMALGSFREAGLVFACVPLALVGGALSLFLLVTAANGVWLSLLVWRRTARVVLSLLVVSV